MNEKEFNEFLNAQLEQIRTTLMIKGAEYVPGAAEEISRFHNFEQGAHLNGQTIEQTLWGFVTKHIVSVSDMVQDDPLEHALAKWDEKIGDITVYMLLLHAMVTKAHHAPLEGIKEAGRKPPLQEFPVAIHTEPIDQTAHIPPAPPTAGAQAVTVTDSPKRDETVTGDQVKIFEADALNMRDHWAAVQQNPRAVPRIERTTPNN